MITVMVGGQWGDEAKAGITDFILGEHEVFIRCNGGPNAGGSVILPDGEKFVYKQLPPGGLARGAKLIIGKGTCVDLGTLIKEIETLRKYSPDFEVIVDSKYSRITREHIEEDEENVSRIGSVGAGVGPCIVSRIKRDSLMMGSYDFFEDHFRLADTTEEIFRLIDEGKNLLFYVAHGTELDILLGDFPNVTTSSCTSSSIANTGVHPSLADRIVLCVKAYSTRVGPGEFNDLSGEVAEKIRLKGHEFGSVSGRSRRIGWIDLKQLKRSVRINRPTMIALTMVDVLAGFERVGVWTTEGKLEYMEGWTTEDIKEFIDQNRYTPCLNAFADYVSYIERAVGCKIEIVSYGPDRSKKSWVRIDSLEGVRNITPTEEEGEWR